MKKVASNYLEIYGNIIIYVVFIMGTLIIANVFNIWSGNTPPVIIFVMCLLVLFDIFRQAMIDPQKGKKLRKIILIIIVSLAILGVLWALFFK